MPRLRIPPPPPIGPVAGSVLAMAFVMLALLLQLVLGPILYTGPYFAFLGAVFVSAWLGGFPGGLLASALSAVLVNVFFIEPRGTFSASHSALMTTGIFVGAAIVVTFLSAALQAGYRERVHVQSEALRARDDFLSVASHELRTPIMLAQLQVQRLRRQLRRGEADRVRLLAQVESTEASIVRLGALVDALLDVSRVASGSLVAKRVPVDLSETVSDRGIGIAAGDLARIFDRFERASSSRQYGGLGLGLWISREIVRASGGSIAVESTPGEGATFKVELPLPAPSSAA